MSLPILLPSTYETTHVRGEVTVDSSAMIAMGVILNATPGNKIVIHGGVCLGMGTVITAYDGDIVIKPNAILGAGCLIFGRCVIGNQASLGASVTIYNVNVSAGDVISAGSIRGDRTRQISLDSYESMNSEGEIQGAQKARSNSEEEIVDNQDHPSFSTINSEEDVMSENKIDDKKEKTLEEKELKQDVWQDETPPNGNNETAQGDQVVGKVYINKLLFTLFPERNI